MEGFSVGTSKVYFLASSLSKPADLYSVGFTGGKPAQLTRLNQAVLEQRKILNSIRNPNSRQRQEQERRGRVQNADPREVNVGATDPALTPKMEEIDYSKLQPFEVEDWSNE